MQWVYEPDVLLIMYKGMHDAERARNDHKNLTNFKYLSAVPSTCHPRHISSVKDTANHIVVTSSDSLLVLKHCKPHCFTSSDSRAHPFFSVSGVTSEHRTPHDRYSVLCAVKRTYPAASSVSVVTSEHRTPHDRYTVLCPVKRTYSAASSVSVVTSKHRTPHHRYLVLCPMKRTHSAACLLYTSPSPRDFG